MNSFFFFAFNLQIPLISKITKMNTISLTLLINIVPHIFKFLFVQSEGFFYVPDNFLNIFIATGFSY